MILEWIEYLRTPASTQAKKFGHLQESIALKARASRQNRNWKSHLENCHQAVIEFLDPSARGHRPARSLTILGSGHLFDIPMMIMDKNQYPGIENIFLVDLIHPLEIRSLAKRDSRIHLVELDLSGGLDQVKRNSFLPGQALEILPIELPYADLVISANLMSQLPLPWLREVQSRKMTDKESHEFEQTKISVESCICENHWNMLYRQTLRGSAVLFWTDFEKSFFDGKGQLVHRESSLGRFKFPVEVKTWAWDIAPIPEISKEFSLQMQVACGQIF